MIRPRRERQQQQQQQQHQQQQQQQDVATQLEDMEISSKATALQRATTALASLKLFLKQSERMYKEKETAITEQRDSGKLLIVHIYLESIYRLLFFLHRLSVLSFHTIT